MKKVIFTTLLLIAIGSLMGCKNNSDVDDGLKHVTLEDVNSLFIINPTLNRKTDDETWVKIRTSSRMAEIEEEEAALNFSFTDRTIPNVIDYSKLIPKKARDIDPGNKTIPTTTYKLRETFMFKDAWTGTDTIYGRMLYEGEHCYIWIDEDADKDALLTEEEIITFANKFDTIYENETALVGSKYSGDTIYENIINPCKKISIVLFDIGKDKNNGNVDGYFTSNDFTKGWGNDIEAIYIDSYFAKKVPPELHSTLAHEFNHMLNYVNKVLKYGLWYETWYTEMLSLTVQDIFEEDLGVDILNSVKGRLIGFVTNSNFVSNKNDPENKVPERGYNYGFGNWRDLSTDVHTFDNYSCAYAFGAYLARNYGGIELIHEIATNDKIGVESVVSAVNKINGTNYTFDDLLSKFPYILINSENENENLPTLCKEIKQTINGIPYTLYKISPSELNPNIKIKPNPVNEASNIDLDSYGIQYYQFDEATNIDLAYKDFLIIKTY